MPRRRILAVALGAPLLAPAAAHAHGLVGRTDLPVPESAFIGAAAAVLVVSFVALAGLWQQPRLQDPRERRLFALGRWVDVVGGVFGVGMFVLTVYAGLAGTEAAQANFAPTAVFVVLWAGIPLLSLLLGDIWRVLSPWRAIGRATGWAVRRVAGEDMPEPLDYPPRLGLWPAVAGLAAFGWIELVWSRNDEPSALAVAALAYAVVQFVGMSVYGVEQWTRRGDAFEAYFSLFARLAPLVRRDGVLYARLPLAGLATSAPPAGWVWLVTTAIGITAFDGFQEGKFTEIVDDLQQFFVDVGFSLATALTLAFTVGLIGCVLAVSALYRLGVAGVGRLRGSASAAVAFASSLLPIVAAYVIAHYFSLLAYNGQAVAFLISDPLGEGSDVFGTADSRIDYGWISATGIWYVQVGALVIGHVAGLVLSHDRALALSGSAKEATRSQLVMLLVMVCFTVLGLWLLSEANA